MTHRVILCLGSNKDAATNISRAQHLLQELLPGLQFTETLTTAPVGIDSPDFLNCLGWGETSLSYGQLLKKTKSLERQLGDRRTLREKNEVVLDVDILLFDNVKYHPDDWDRDYVKALLALSHR